MASFADLALPIPRDERDPTAAPSESAEDRASDVIIVNQAEGSTATQRPAGQGPGQDGSRPSAAPKKRRHIPEEDLAPISEVLLHRLTTIKEGDNVLLRLPSDQIKAVVASKDGLLNLGKFGAFPCKELLGLHYDITYELYSTTPDPDDDGFGGRPGGSAGSSNMPNQFGQGKGKKTKKQKKADAAAAAEQDGRVKSNPGWAFALRPLRRPTVADAVIDDITETNEFIDDTDAVKQAMLTQEEIFEMRASGASAEEIMEAQMKRHERFDLKTDFSKEKWRKKKEKKYTQTVHPIAPSAYNIARHQFARLPQSILHLRDDTLSQLLSTANIRPGGRYMVVDDTGGLVTAAILERMGCMGRIMTFTDADSPPAWGVLNTMNFGERELACVKWLNWLQAEENYEPQPLPDESQLPEIAPNKKFMRERKHLFQLAELNATRDELHRGGWDGLIMATELNPLSVLARLSPYLAGSANIVIYSPHLQVLAEVLVHAKSTPIYLNPALTESWSRTYQVLPGRTHPLMTTSATGGYLLHMIRVFDSDVDTRTFQYDRLKKNKEANKKRKAAELADTAENAEASGSGTSAAAQADDTSGPEGAAAQTAAGDAVDDMQEGGMEEDDAGTTRSGDETAEGDVDMLL